MEQMPCGEFEANAMYFSPEHLGIEIQSHDSAEAFCNTERDAELHDSDTEMETCAGSGMDSCLAILKKQGFKAEFNKRNGVVRPEKVILEIFETVKGSKSKIQNTFYRLVA